MPPKRQMKKGKTAATMRKHQFFKVLLGDFMKQLRIPPKFLKHVWAAADEEEPPKTRRAILEGPSGSSWRVAVERTAGEAFLTTGWGKFARDHSLREHDFLVFRYDGDMHFTVSIFDKTACLREDAFAVRPWRKPPPPPPCQDGWRRGRSRKLELRGAMIKEEAVEHGSSLEELIKREGHETDPLQIQLAAIREEESELPMRSDQRPARGQTGYYVSKRRALTEEERMKAQEAASSFISAFPCIVVPMRASQVYSSTVRIANWFSRDHLPLKKSILVLRDPGGKSWNTTYLPGSRNQISRGWMAFARANRLEEGDCCVFEVIGPVDLRVHIFRAVDEPQPANAMMAIAATK